MAGDVIGFRPVEAAQLAAAWFPASDGLAELEGPDRRSHWVPLDDGTNRAVNPETGELVRQVPTVELHRMRPVRERKIKRRLVIAGGKIAVECDHLDQVEKRLEAIEAAMEIEALLDTIEGDWHGDLIRGQQLDHTDDDEEDGYGRVIWEFSRKSRQRLRQRVAEADWYTALQRPGTRIGMLTLTYSGHWRHWAPSPEVITRHRHALEKRLIRALGYLPAFFWVREFQRRGAPHFHLAGAWPTRIEGIPLRRWLSRTWYDIVGSGDPRHLRAGTRVDWSTGLEASDPNRLAAYFSSYTTGRDGKEYQHHPPEGWCNQNGSAGRHWGYRGVELTRSEVALTRDQMIEAQRFLRRYIASQKRTMRTKGPTGDRTRTVNRRWRLSSLQGLDTGFTLLTNDGPSLAVALARAIEHQQRSEEPWPPGQLRPLP